jgi:hypothetical protein
MTPDAITRLFKEAYDTTILQQLTSANLALTTSNATLTAANKKPRRLWPKSLQPRMRQRPPTQWEVAKPTKDGTHIAPDSVGGRI